MLAANASAGKIAAAKKVRRIYTTLFFFHLYAATAAPIRRTVKITAKICKAILHCPIVFISSAVNSSMESFPPPRILFCILSTHSDTFHSVYEVWSFEYFKTGMENHGRNSSATTINPQEKIGSIAFVSTPVACFCCMLLSLPLLLLHPDITVLPSGLPLLYKNYFRQKMLLHFAKL